MANAKKYPPIGSEGFKNLEASCYLKLRKCGFKDIEDTSRSDRPLKNWDSFRFRNKQEVMMETIALHDKFLDLLNNYNFPTEYEREVWQLHCEGHTHRRIVALTKRFKNRLKSTQVLKLIQFLTEKAKALP